MSTPCLSVVHLSKVDPSASVRRGLRPLWTETPTWDAGRQIVHGVQPSPKSGVTDHHGPTEPNSPGRVEAGPDWRSHSLARVEASAGRESEGLSQLPDAVVAAIAEAVSRAVVDVVTPHVAGGGVRRLESPPRRRVTLNHRAPRRGD